MMRELLQNCDDGGCALGHIYREFNADADSLANIAIDGYRGTPVVISDNWNNTQLPPGVHRLLR